MEWIWAVLGAVLIVLLLVVLFSFFIWRPRARDQVGRATQAIAEELHGRPPIMIAPAQCSRADIRDAEQVKGLGVVALTEQAVLFSRGERVVILSRDGLRSSASGTSLELVSQTPPGTLVLTMPDTAPWQAELST